jgi:thioredoxin 1
MATVRVTKDNIEQTIKGHKLVILDFWAPWCAPCRTFGPTFERASNEHPDVLFGKVDTESEPEVAGYFGITSIPTIMVFKEAIGIYQESGAIPPRALEEVITSAQKLDMDVVRKELERQANSPDEVPWELRDED